MTVYVWDDVTGSWNDNANWTPTGFPFDGDTTEIGNSASYVLSVGGGTMCPGFSWTRDLTLNDANATLDVPSTLLVSGTGSLDAGRIGGGGTVFSIPMSGSPCSTWRKASRSMASPMSS